MYKATIRGKSIKLNNRDYNALVQRFTLSNAIQDTLYGGQVIIKRKCLCVYYRKRGGCEHKHSVEYKNSCEKCPFRAFECAGIFGCVILLNEIPLLTSHIGLEVKQVIWQGRYDLTVRREIMDILSWITSTFIKIERR